MPSCWVHSASQAGDQTASLFREPHLHIPDDKSLNEWTAVLAARIEATIHTIASEADPDHGAVRFGFPLTMGSGQVPTLIAEFHRRVSGIRLQIKQAHGSELSADLKSGALDVAVVIPPPPDVRHTVMGTQPIRVVVPKDHQFASRRRLRLEEIRNEIFIANPISYNLDR
jgi:DNA-binding transcriptional LysR family regulator